MPRRLAVAVVGMLLLAGCSSSGTPSTTSTSRVPTDETSRSADQIYSDVVAAMRRVDHVVISGTQTDDTGTYGVKAEVTPSTARVSITVTSGALVVLVVGGHAYASQADSPFVELSGTDAVRAEASTLSKTLDCAVHERGALTKGGISTVDGVRTIALHDDGKAAGDSPGTSYIALDSLRVVKQTIQGAATPGGSDACGHSPNDTLSAATLHFDYTTPVTPPTPPASPSASGGPVI